MLVVIASDIATCKLVHLGSNAGQYCLGWIHILADIIVRYTYCYPVIIIIMIRFI